jgi:BirA family biotin operon repressor/biotin-[acetyl-CoA-carboxylase] ligase
VHDLDETESTQVALAALAAAGAPEGTVVTARHQRAGRGRRGHSWWDEPGQSMLFSVLLRPPVPLGDAPQLSVVAGLAVAEGLDALGVSAGIKWPNDVLIGGRKVAGVLAEAVGGAGGLRHVLLGIGVNVDQLAFPEPLADTATSLRLATGRACEPRAVLRPVLDRLTARYEEWLATGLAGLLGAWRLRSVTLGAAVRTPGAGDAVAVDVGVDGALVVRLADGTLARLLAPAGAEAP